MEISGKVHLIEQEKEVGSNGFKKRLLVVETEEQYKQYIPIDFLKDKCDLLDKFNVGDQVKVSINLRGNEYNSKYYVSINAWKIEKLSEAPTKEPDGYMKGNDIPVEDDELSGLPF